jgi:hypothetical protein
MMKGAEGPIEQVLERSNSHYYQDSSANEGAMTLYRYDIGQLSARTGGFRGLFEIR